MKPPIRTSPKQLKSYFSPACPLNWLPCDGNEPMVRISCGFTPKWYRDRLNIDFGKRWHTDVRYRHKSLVLMHEEIRSRFRSLDIVRNNLTDLPYTIDGVFGALLLPGLFGIPIRYHADNWPVAEHKYLSKKQAMALKVPNLQNNPLFTHLIDQMELIRKEWGRVEGCINFQGIFNVAYRLRGEEIFTDMLLDPSLVRHVVEVIYETMKETIGRIYELQKVSGTDKDYVVISNCLVNMISPELYEKFLLPLELRLARSFSSFGVHNCAWDVSPYIESYAKLEPLSYLDMGLSSDFKLARQTFPNARLAIMLTPNEISMGLEELKANILRIYHEAAPCDIILADVDTHVSDEQIQMFLECSKPTTLGILRDEC